jgi:hypothetical protein
MTSADGIHWSAPIEAGPCGDRSTCYYDPFRAKWVFSLRGTGPQGRIRKYWDSREFLEGRWLDQPLPDWVAADELDKPGACAPQLYNLDAVAYESLMLGLFEIHRGPTNEVCEQSGLPKQTDLHVGFSRDGFHWHRPDREPFIASDPVDGSWERGYVQSVGGVCLVGRDEIWFYYTAFAGDPSRRGLDWKHNGMYANGATGLAILRKDGFASLEAMEDEGFLVTRPVLFSGDKLWINAEASRGWITAEFLDSDGRPIEGLGAPECLPVSEDSTAVCLQWKSGQNLAFLQDRPVQIRFRVKNASLYSFWITSDPDGGSGGYSGAGSLD